MTHPQLLPVILIDLSELHSSRGPQNIPRFLGLPGSDLPYSPVMQEPYKQGARLVFEGELYTYIGSLN